MNEPVILVLMAQLCIAHRKHNGDEKPRELRLTPRAYRDWRQASPHTETFFGVPVRCAEVLPQGFHLMAVH